MESKVPVGEQHALALPRHFHSWKKHVRPVQPAHQGMAHRVVSGVRVLDTSARDLVGQISHCVDRACLQNDDRLCPRMPIDCLHGG